MIYFFSTPAGSVIATQANDALQASDIDKLCWLYGEAKPIEGEAVEGFFIGPRREMITPWSTNAVEITQNMGLSGIVRIEEYFQVENENAGYDPMLQRIGSHFRNLNFIDAAVSQSRQTHGAKA